MKTKTSENLLFGCQDNLNNLWVLLHHFQKFVLSVKTIHLHDNDIIMAISFSNFSTLETVFYHRFLSFFLEMQGENARKILKKYSCRWGLNPFLNHQSWGHEAPHHNFVVIAPMIMKFYTDIKRHVFYTMITKMFVTSLLLRNYDIITSILADE